MTKTSAPRSTSMMSSLTVKPKSLLRLLRLTPRRLPPPRLPSHSPFVVRVPLRLRPRRLRCLQLSIVTLNPAHPSPECMSPECMSPVPLRVSTLRRMRRPTAEQRAVPRLRATHSIRSAAPSARADSSPSAAVACSSTRRAVAGRPLSPHLELLNLSLRPSEQ